MRDAIDALEASDIGAVSLPFFSPDEVAALSLGCRKLPFRKAKAVEGNNVRQDFDICFPAPRTGVFDDCANLLEAAFGACHADAPDLFEAPLRLNDFAVQHYPAGSTGIGVHRDSLQYRNLVCIIALAGTSQFYVCTDRDGAGRQNLDESQGRLVLLSAPGFRGLDDPDKRPLHGVDAVVRGRLSLGFRMTRLGSKIKGAPASA